MNIRFSLFLALLAAPAMAQETRQMDSHVHGIGELDIAVDGKTVSMQLRAPGADIVGFEHAAESAADQAAIEAAIAALSRPLDLFALSAAAECSVVQATAQLESEAAHDRHDKHGDHADHADEHGDDHADEHGSTHAGQESPGQESPGQESHSEFHASYSLTCGNPAALARIDFGYFIAFGNARELAVQVATASGARAFDVTRDKPALDLRAMF